jgi:hypothetical protein
MFEKMRGSFKDVEDPNRLFEIKMNIRQSRYEMYDECLINFLESLRKFLKNNTGLIKREW